MAAGTQIELSPQISAEVARLAEILQETPEHVAEQVFYNGLYTMNRYARLLSKAGSVSAEDGLAILRQAGKGNAPDPGDELPDDLKYLLDAKP